MKKTLIFLFIFISCFLFSQEISFNIKDKPNDDGAALILSWDTSQIEASKIIIERKAPDSDLIIITSSQEVVGTFEDGTDIDPGIEYNYRLSALDENGKVLHIVRTTASSSSQWFNKKKISLLILALLISVSIVYYIFSAKSGKDLYIRKIGGLESMDESVGRATEMGRPILFIPGTLDLDDMQTIAGLTLLRRLAQKAAEYDAKLIVPVCRSMVLSTAKEVVKEAYMKAGRPDAFDPDSVFYLTDDQFGYVAGVDGIIVREKPAANFFLGAFYAESLILAETGFSSGAIQTAGTAMPSQLPFFVVACDYTLIGEELFAASAYLSKDPHQLGSLKGQDFGKAIFIVVLTIGIILEISGVHFLKDFLALH
ncbi:MAG: hypothetical protein HOD64_09450 [Candidatus Cloacimonetes bacterium]|jgi:hypothetical protein|nr:hypothetical protein [Candidatus Cloacimonadota bacterium]MBT4333488.1 hypothetical protein [Candidatus Cloacimonadota bacterium]MBT4576110.1 hypothetical protein [Candidatus Cloacimonadota bacterium]